MPDYMSTWPFWGVFAFLYVGATVRAQATYWVGRVVTDQALRRTHPRRGWRRRAHEALQGEGTRRGVDAIRRWGLVVIPLAYLTVGFQTMVMAGAGVLRIGWGRFTLAQIPGALAWAGIYSTIGFAVWNAALAAAAGSPLGLAAIAAVALVVVVATVVVRKRRRIRRDAPAAAAGAGAGAQSETPSEAPSGG